jgi:hypothetical protein
VTTTSADVRRCFVKMPLEDKPMYFKHVVELMAFLHPNAGYDLQKTIDEK